MNSPWRFFLNYNKNMFFYSPNLQFMKYDCFNKCWSFPKILLGNLLTQSFHFLMTESGITKTSKYLSNKLYNQLATHLLTVFDFCNRFANVYSQSYVKEVCERWLVCVGYVDLWKVNLVFFFFLTCFSHLYQMLLLLSFLCFPRFILNTVISILKDL